MEQPPTILKLPKIYSAYPAQKAKSRNQPTAHMAMWNRIQQCVPKRPQELCQSIVRRVSHGFGAQAGVCLCYLRAEDFAGDTGVLLHAVPPQCITAARSFVRVAIFQVYETEAFGRVQLQLTEGVGMVPLGILALPAMTSCWTCRLSHSRLESCKQDPRESEQNSGRSPRCCLVLATGRREEEGTEVQWK